MRLLFVHDRFGAMAGAEVNAWLTASELKDRGHTLGIIHGTPTGKGESAWQEVFGSRFGLNGVSSSDTVQSAFQQFRPDLVYVHKMADLGVLGALVKSGIPVVRMVHDHDLYCMRSYKYHPVTRRVCARPTSAYCIFGCGASLVRNREGWLPIRWVSYWAKRKEIRLNQQFARMIVASHYMKHELLRNGFESRRIEIHAPVPRSNGVKVRSNFSKRNLLIYAGQIVRGKGVDVLLQALSLLRVPFECLILGEGNHKPYCERLCRKLGLEQRVRFKGYVPMDELEGYYAEASVAVMSSVWPEPFGGVGVEAMRYGLPVVAFDVGGVPDWLVDGQTGFLVPWMDRHQFAARIEQLLNDKTLANQLGARAKQLVGEKHDFGTYVTGLEGTFERVLGESCGRLAAPLAATVKAATVELAQPADPQCRPEVGA